MGAKSTNMKTYSPKPGTDSICRSLLQKAVRRSDVSVARSAAILLIEKNDTAWLKNRLGVITFEESWKESGALEFSLDPQKLITQYERLAKSIKNKDAAGLGALAYELSRGDSSMLTLDAGSNRAIKIISEAIQRPADFWQWIHAQKVDWANKAALSNCEIGYKHAGWPWDKAFAISAAYLSVFHESQEISQPNTESIDCPYWIAIDKHTPEGKSALARCEKKFRLEKTLIGWIQFYLESARCSNFEPAIWWERERNWRLAKHGLSVFDASQLWLDISGYIREILQSTDERLTEELKKATQAYEITITKQQNLI